jgi:hypothetical protein
MAFLTDNTFHSVVFLVPTDPAWAALSPVPGVPEGIAADVYAGNPVLLFVIDAANGVFAFEGGQGYNYDDTLIDSSTALTNYAATPVSGNPTRYGKTILGAPVFYFDDVAQTVREYISATASALKAFLP